MIKKLRGKGGGHGDASKGSGGSSNSNKTFLTSTNDGPFDTDSCAVVFVMGPPGSGKRSQCENLLTNLKNNRIVHISTTSLLSKKCCGKQTEESKVISEHMDAHKPLPGNIVVPIIANAIRTALTRSNGAWINFLISSFPRSIDQLDAWKKDIPSANVPCKIMLQCPLFTCKSRLSAPSGGAQSKARFKSLSHRYGSSLTAVRSPKLPSTQYKPLGSWQS